MVRNVQSDILIRLGDVNELRKQFGLQPFDETQHPKGSIIMLKALNSDLMELEERKEKSIETQVEIYNKVLTLSHRIQKPFKEIEDITEIILTNDEFQNLRSSLMEFEDIYESRIMEVEQLKEESLKIIKNLKNNASLSNEQMELLDKNYEKDESTVVSKSLIEQLTILDRLERDYQNMEEKYERGRPVFDKLNEWMTLWKEKLNAEKKACRTSFYNQRGGNLQASLKRQKVIAAKVPKCQQELQKIVEDYVHEHGDEDILIEGMLPDKYAEFLMKEYEHDREVQRSQKVLLKKPTSEVKTRTQASKLRPPQVTKSLIRPPKNIEKSKFKTPSSLKARKRSLSCDDLSIISPLRTPTHGPFTSSPKQGRYGALSTISGSSGYGGTSTSTGIPMSACKTPTSTKSRPWY